jgi:hypothetical protein
VNTVTGFGPNKQRIGVRFSAGREIFLLNSAFRLDTQHTQTFFFFQVTTDT